MAFQFIFVLLIVPLIATEPKIWKKTDLTYSIDNSNSGMSESDTRDAIQSAFDTWSAVTPLLFKEVTTGSDIIFKFEPFDGKGNKLAQTLFPEDGKVYFYFDADESWTVMNEEHLPVSTHTDLLKTSIHGIGHVLGLDHSDDPSSIMSQKNRAPTDEFGQYQAPGLSPIDVKTIQDLYRVGSNYSVVPSEKSVKSQEI